MAERSRSRSRHALRSPRIRASRNQYSPEGNRDNVCIEEVDYSSEYEVQHRPTRNVSCQTRTKYVLKPHPNQKSHLRNEHPIGYITKKESLDERGFQRQDYKDSQQEYVMRRPSTRNVRCQMTTHYTIQPQRKQRKKLHKKIPVFLHPDTPSPRSLTPLSDNIEVIIYYDKDFESLYPKSRKNSRQFVHYIDLRQPTDTLQPKPIEVFGLAIISQLKKDGYIYDKVTDDEELNTRNSPMENPIERRVYIYDKVTDDGEINTRNSSMERHGPAERFCHERQQLQNSNLSAEQKKNVIYQTIVYDYR
ncbi:uncharacterized protein LOC127724247 [Mytilus californianus]|uniref:uncharacterized protein LOC127724247 n=1 Tax=Mytilus californianus TaxID=6549 RepID=UPI002246271F|nr:uncharacterized protein LOC127724247 [Mytilus californianus]